MDDGFCFFTHPTSDGETPTVGDGETPTVGDRLQQIKILSRMKDILYIKY
ncbi:MAG TPA: hypothetical protein VK184_19420 [Nostocaceae cyanobacterium]|nr:hypothetical protein [Nostocaceae cyanobacterium]